MKALLETQKSLEIYEQTKNPAGKASCLNAFGMISEFSGLYSEALKYFQKALEIAEDEGMEVEAWSTYMNIGVIHGHLENYELALNYFNKVLSNIEDERAYTATGLIYANIAETYRSMDQYSMAKDYYLIALDHFKSTNNPVDLSLHLTSYGNLLLDLGLFDQAKEAFIEGLQLSDSLNLDDRKVQNAIGLTDTYTRRGDFEKANKVLEENQIEFDQIQNPRTQLKLLKVREELAKKEDNYTLAYSISSKYHQLNDSLLSVKQDAQFSQMETMFQLEGMQKENASLKDYLKATQKFNLAVAISLVVFLGLIILISKFYSSKERANQQLQELNKSLITNQEELEKKAIELEKANQEISRINSLLEKKIEERTQDLLLKNKKILDFTFFNSHQVRGALARILGLLEISPEKELEGDESEINRLLKEQALELDALVKKINHLLKEEGYPSSGSEGLE